MAELRALEEPQEVILGFTYNVEEAWIEQTIDEEGHRPASKWEVTFDLSEVPSPDLRRRIRLAHEYYSESPDFPTLPAPTEDPGEFAEGIEAWQGAVEQAAAESAEESRAESEAEATANAAFEAERSVWVAEHGSQRLKLAVERGYKANRTYALERAAIEFPEFWVDTAEDLEWNERVDPSETALDLEIQTREVIEKLDLDSGTDARIVWLIEAPRAVDRALEEADEEFEPQEVIVVTQYLHRYALAMPVDPDHRVNLAASE